MISLFDPKLVADLIQRRFVALADRGDVRLRVFLINRDKFGAEAETHEGDIDLIRHRKNYGEMKVR